MDASAPTDAPERPPLSHEQFMRLFLQAERDLLRYVMALVPNVSDARDVVQETAVALWNAVDKYDPRRPFTPWACRFALNEARHFLRSESRRRRFLEEDVLDLLETRRVELAPAFNQRRQYLPECLGRLPDDQHSLIRGYYFDEEPMESLAARLGRGSDALYKSLQRIRQALHICLERKLLSES